MCVLIIVRAIVYSKRRAASMDVPPAPAGTEVPGAVSPAVGGASTAC